MEEQELLQRLENKIVSIRNKMGQREKLGHPTSEADTERLIIEPLLETLGYDDWQVIQHGRDNVTRGIPDYTIIYDTNRKWMLEAKSITHPLSIGDAQQAVNYANNEGAEWAVLTNGRTWYIYNAHLPKPLIEKRVIQINDLFSDADAVGKLLLLSRQSMQSGGLNGAWIKLRVADIVKNQLDTANSPVREQLREISSEVTGAAIDDATVGEAIASLHLIAAITPIVGPIDLPTKPTPVPPYPPPVLVQKTLGELVGIPVSGASG